LDNILRSNRQNPLCLPFSQRGELRKGFPSLLKEGFEKRVPPFIEREDRRDLNLSPKGGNVKTCESVKV
jgi:hypothetical protein